MLVGYCIRRAGDPAPQGVKAPGGEAVTLLEEEGLGLWISAAAPGPPDAAGLRGHDAVVRAALRSATPLPLRYAATFRDESAAREALRARRDEWLGALDRVAGRVEMGVQVIGGTGEASREPNAPSSSIRSGREYLEVRRREMERAEATCRHAAEALDRVALPFAPLDLPTARVIAPAPGVLGSLAHLVHRSELERYQIAASEAARAALPLRVRVSGPWAPYSFV